MDRRFIIVHPSYIIRQGLISLMRQERTIDIIEVAGCDDLSNYSSMQKKNILFVVDSALDESEIEASVLSFRTSNLVKVMYLSGSVCKTDRPEKGNGYLYLDSSKEQLCEKLFEQPWSLTKITEKETISQPMLTDREKDVLTHVAMGKSNKEMADELSISIHTVISHRKNITEKLGIKSISGLTVYAILNKLIDTHNIDLESLI